MGYESKGHNDNETVLIHPNDTIKVVWDICTILILLANVIYIRKVCLEG